MKLHTEREGELYVASAVALWSLFPIFIALSYNSVSPFISLSVSSLFAALFFGVILTIRKRWHEVFNRKALPYILGATLMLSILYNLLYFFGVSFTSPGNVSILALTELCFSFLLFHVWHKDYIPREHIVGAALIFLSACIVLLPNTQGFRPGNLLIVGAAAVAPFGNFFAQKARKLVSTETILFIRCLISSVIIFLFASAFHTVSSVGNLEHALIFLVANGTLLLGLSTFLWVEGIHRITVTKSNAIQSLSPMLTLLFAWIFLHTLPTVWQIVAFIPMSIGVVFIGKIPKLQKK